VNWVVRLEVWEWTHLLYLVEAALLLPAAAIAWRTGRAERILRRLARHRMASLWAGVLALGLRAALLPIEPIPKPSVGDEFSFLLAADTFMHGRVANPTHPMWRHFETLHVDQQPAYVSMYPPMQGLVLAAGRLLTGVAFAGVWLSAGAMCAAICWALQGWFPPGWAFLGGVLAAIRLGTFSYWADSYWGGAPAAIGGALLLGALPRFIRSGRARHAAIAAIGAAIVANSRPYEGLVLSIAVACVAIAQARKPWRVAALAPAAAILLSVAALMAYYNWRAFGNPTRLPYTIQRNTYAMAPHFIFQPVRPAPAYRHESMRAFYQGWELNAFDRMRTPLGFAANEVKKLAEVWTFFIGPALTLPLVALAWTWRSRRTRTLAALAAVVYLGSLPVPWFAPHYAAPATALIYALLIAGMRALRRWRPAMAFAIPAVVVAMLAVRVAMAVTPIPFLLDDRMTWGTTWSPPNGRAAIIQRLEAAGGRHLVIVHYRPSYYLRPEYVYNDADIDHARIVWAHDMGAEKNAELLRYFPQRRVWLIDTGEDAPRLTPYR